MKSAIRLPISGRLAHSQLAMFLQVGYVSQTKVHSQLAMI
jgi:hypothetical protein